MASAITMSHAAAPASDHRSAARRRILLFAVAMSAIGLGTVIGPGTAFLIVDPDLVRLLHFMAVLKGAFALLAFGISYWRLERPAALWREVVYVVGPGLMVGGALCLWQLQSAGLAAAGLHIGLFALLAAALTDGAFIPRLVRPAA
ncbi:hypothetical protein [Methylobacterium haplocladii]|uniref:Uncharacterized protein n=1 Tax=Methylobacterium haplocladii TaxID=1176176 RepID=A0A512IS21_9HYPH|nr:hypothetical protein [Methylobacterium haplocladii]GEP00504.1 hypothetical protein MHA02_28910 [Methylobacterium haplocladii]GJD82474.1 hypothetical protein HPGCJGGD_0330 [Methylobacterium haplocladii]GLS59559.1 hypothetical protein GCM10007887_22280 [Methylobacterium haplocladii]